MKCNNCKHSVTRLVIDWINDEIDVLSCENCKRIVKLNVREVLNLIRSAS